MATATHVILVDDEHHVETGVWCPRCNLPAGFRAPILGLSDVGVSHLGTITRCFDCNEPIRP